MRDDSKRGSFLMAAAVTLLAVFWSWQFAPVLFRQQNLLGLRLLDARITGLQASSERRSIFNRLPSQDASMVLTHYPYQYYLAACLDRGVFPLWNPLVGCGAPVTSDPQYKPLNPFFWPFFAFPSAWLFSLGIALMALAGLMGWLLFLREVGLGWPAVLIGTCLMVFSPLTGQTIVLSSSWVAWMAPWALWAAERWHLRRRGGMPLLAAAVALMAYVGHPLIAVLYAAIVVAYLVSRPSDRNLPERARALVAVAALTFLLTAVHTWPLLGAARDYWSYKAHWDGGPFCRWFMLANPKSEIYVPMPLWGLAFLGLLYGQKRLRLFFFGALAYGAVVMFPWVQGPLRWVLTFGGYLVARYGEEAFWLGLIGLAVLGVEAVAAAPADPLRDRWARLRVFCYGAAWYVGFAWATVLEGNLFWPSVFKRLPPWNQYLVWEVLACLAVAAVTVIRTPRTRAALLVLGALLLVAIPTRLPLAVSRYFSSEDLSIRPPAIVDALRERAAANPPARMSAAYYELDFLADLCPNQNLVWGLEDVRLTSPLILKHYREFAEHWNSGDLFGTYCFFPKQDPGLLQFLGVRWFVSDLARPLDGLPVTTKEPPLALQEVPDPASWVRPVGRWEVAADADDGWRKSFEAIRSGAWRTVAVLDGAPDIPEAGPAWTAPHVSWLETGPNRWRWEVQGDSASLLLVLMNDHPGWRCRVDGEPAKILRAYGTFMAVAVPAGRHEVALAFHAPWFLAGLAASALGWLAVAAWALLEWRRGRPREGPGP